MFKRLFSILTALLLLLALAVPAFATGPVSITTVDDLELLRKNPTGEFRLDADLNLAGVDWTPIDFSGTFDGNGHTIVNLTVTKTGNNLATFWDGNLSMYSQTYLAGFFGYLQDAEVKDLTLLGVNVDITIDNDCFIGAIAGCAEDSEISGCTVSGTLTLHANAKAEGVGGIVGFGGAGKIEDCTADVTLVCIDTNKNAKDEQFLGGIAASGFLDMNNCTVNLKAYISEHGYVHSGGLTGLYRVYRDGWFEQGSIKGNSVSGFIRFFEHCDSRRAYCEAFIGEQMTSYCVKENNTSDFTRDEIYVYTEDLLPHDCENATYDVEDVLLSGGITCKKYTCSLCGEYSYLADYLLAGEAVETSALEEAAAEESVADEEPVEEPVEEVIAPAPEEETPEEEIILINPASEEPAADVEAEPLDMKAVVKLVLNGEGEQEDFPMRKLVPAVLILAVVAVVATTAYLIIKKK